MAKTILYILDYYLPHKGGVETVFEQIISRSLEQGYNAIVLTTHYTPELPREEDHGSFRIFRVGASRKGFLRSALWQGRKLLKRYQIDMIHTSTYGGAIPASLLAWWFGKKCLITVHEIFGKLWNRYKPWWSAWIYRFFEWLIFVLPYTHYHCVSLYTLNALRLVYGIADEKLSLIYNGVDNDFWEKTAITEKEKTDIQHQFSLHGRWNLLYFGHTGISKGIDTLLDAIPLLMQRFPDLQLILNFIAAERGVSVRQRVEQMLSYLPKEDAQRIQLHHGFEKNVLRALVANVDAVIAPSLSEGFGSVHTETLALGTPLITTMVASIPEVVGGKVVLTSPGKVDALLEAVERAKHLDFEPLVEKRFDRKQQFAKIRDLYYRILS